MHGCVAGNPGVDPFSARVSAPAGGSPFLHRARVIEFIAGFDMEVWQRSAATCFLMPLHGPQHG